MLPDLCQGIKSIEFTSSVFFEIFLNTSFELGEICERKRELVDLIREYCVAEVIVASYQIIYEE